MRVRSLCTHAMLRALHNHVLYGIAFFILIVAEDILYHSHTCVYLFAIKIHLK